MYIEHLALWVRDLEQMRTFYETYFNASASSKYINSNKGFSSYFLSLPGAGTRIELMQMPAIPETKNDALVQFMGLIHFAVRVGNEANVVSLTNQLRTDGYTVIGEPRRTGDGYYESVVLDPEQNRIEIMA